MSEHIINETKFMDVRINERYFLILKTVVKNEGMKISGFVERAVVNFLEHEEVYEKFFLESKQKRTSENNKRIKVRIKDKNTEEKANKICELYGIKISAFIRNAIEFSLFKYQCLESNITKEEYQNAKRKADKLKVGFDEFVEKSCQRFLEESDIEYLIDITLKADEVPEEMKKIEVNFISDQLKRNVMKASEKYEIPLSDFIRVCINYAL